MAKRLTYSKGSITYSVIVDGSNLRVERKKGSEKPKVEKQSFDDADEAMSEAKAKVAELKGKGFTKVEKGAAAAPAGSKTAKTKAAKAKGSKSEGGTTTRERKAPVIVEPTAKPRKKLKGKAGPIVLAVVDQKKHSNLYLPAKDGAELIATVNAIRERLWKMDGAARCDEDTLNVLVSEFGLTPAPADAFEDAENTRISVRIHPRRAGLVAYANTEDGWATMAYDLVSKEGKSKPRKLEEFVEASDLDEVLASA